MKDEAETIRRFLRRLGLKLWLRSLARPLLYSASVGAVMLLALGACNRCYRPVPALAGVAMAIAPIALALAVSLVKSRPGIESIAASADRLFKGKSLLTTALAVIESDSTSPLAAYTIRRAALAARDWNERLDEIPKQALAPLHWPAAAMALAGLFLLILPPAPMMKPKEVDIQAASPVNTQGLAPADYLAQIASPKKQFKKHLSEDASPPAIGGFVPPPSDREEDRSVPANQRLAAQSAKAAGKASQGESSGDAVDLSSPSKPSFQGNAFTAAKRVDIARKGGFGKGEALSSGDGSSRAAPAVRWRPVSSASGGVGAPSFPVAKRHYLDAYFRLIQSP